MVILFLVLGVFAIPKINIALKFEVKNDRIRYTLKVTNLGYSTINLPSQNGVFLNPSIIISGSIASYEALFSEFDSSSISLMPIRPGESIEMDVEAELTRGEEFSTLDFVTEKYVILNKGKYKMKARYNSLETRWIMQFGDTLEFDVSMLIKSQ